MTIWFLIVLSCQSPSDLATCHSGGPPVMTFMQPEDCQTVVLESLRLADRAHLSVAYACELGFSV